MTDRFALPDPATDNVPTALFRRHLGLPVCAELDERVVSLADATRSWYAQHGDPWTAARQINVQRIVDDVVHLDHQQRLHSALLANGLALASVHAIVVVAVAAGKAVDQRIDELWKSGRPDEAMFLNAYTIALVEHLRRQVGAHLSSVLAEKNMTVLPHYSPGYEGWDLADQKRLYRLLRGSEPATHSPLKLLSSGGLTPSKSTLAVYGVSHRTDVSEDLDQFWTCRSIPVSAQDPSAGYAFPEKALSRWRDKRLRITARGADELLATFHFDGSTCSNMGIPLEFDYKVVLQRDRDHGYYVVNCDCQPGKDHKGYQSMCAYLDKPERYMAQLAAHRPMVGRPIHEALTWGAPTSPAGCLCTKASQDHKWRIVLQTIHYALEKHEHPTP